MLRMKPIERTCLAVQLVLTNRHGIDKPKAEQMVFNSAFYQTLIDDPHFVGHRSAEHWAEEVLDEYSVVH